MLQSISGVFLQDIDSALEIADIRNKLISHPASVSFLNYLSAQDFSFNIFSSSLPILISSRKEFPSFSSK